MTTGKKAIIILLIALFGSNLFWIYRTIDFGISYTYMDASATDCFRTLRVTVAVTPIAADPNSSKANVVSAAESVADAESIEKDGVVWVDRLGLGFDEYGRVATVSDGPANSVWPKN